MGESGKIEVLRDEAPEPNFVPTFMAAPAFAGSRQGYVYKQGPAGLGYYRDDKNDDVAQTELQPAASSPNLEFAPGKTPEEEEGVTAYVAAAMKMQAEMECEPEGVAPFGSAHGTCGEFETGLWCRMHVQCQPGRQEFDRPTVLEIVHVYGTNKR